MGGTSDGQESAATTTVAASLTIRLREPLRPLGGPEGLGLVASLKVFEEQIARLELQHG